VLREARLQHQAKDRTDHGRRLAIVITKRGASETEAELIVRFTPPRACVRAADRRENGPLFARLNRFPSDRVRCSTLSQN
jgi:hypothetical protein